MKITLDVADNIDLRNQIQDVVKEGIKHLLDAKLEQLVNQYFMEEKDNDTTLHHLIGKATKEAINQYIDGYNNRYFATSLQDLCKKVVHQELKTILKAADITVETRSIKIEHE